MLKRFLIAGGILFGVLVLVGAVFGTRMYFMIQGFKNQKNVSTVSDEAARAETWQPDFTSVGNLDPVQGADISNQLAGNVVAVNFQSGQEVQKGQLLVQIDDSSERAQLAGFKAQLQLAQITDKRTRDIFSKHLNAQSDVDTADSNLQQAQSNVDNTQATIDKKAIRAPFTGQAGIRNVNVGQYLPEGTVIVTLQDLDHMYASFTLPEQALPSLAPRQKVSLSVDTYPNRRFEGTVNAIDSKIDPNSHTVRVQGLIPNPGHLLRAGMFANVVVSAGKPADVVTIPKAAITYSLYGDSVFVISPDKDKKDDKGQPQLTVNEVFVKLGDERGTRVAVVEGLKAGDEVVTSGMQKLHTGSVVTINNDVPPDATASTGGSGK
ncbi:MAG TPA: efflux RND transporter periplasmic adaptor subunit [Gammaproteobacteria bacterium]|nr:efflux RND transporter periplasmic adaptor subunit [Gammaproteobacteria bacterium]